MTGALDDVLVLEMGTMTAGPFCSELLMQLGARVVKLEARGGESLRRQGRPIAGESYLFQINNAGKQFVTADIRKPRGRQLVLDLAAKADVFLENFSPGALERNGLGYEAVRAVNPRIVYCSVNGFGGVGPLKDKRAYDVVIQGLTGVVSLTGHGEDRAVKAGPSAVDVTGAAVSAMAIAAAVYHQKRTGVGQRLEMAMYDVAAWLSEEVWATCLAGEDQPARAGNRHLLVGVQNTYQAMDGLVAIVADTEAQWAALCRLMEREELAADPKYAGPVERRTQAEELDRVVQEWVGRRSREEVAARCQAAGVPAAPVLGLAEAASHPQILARQMVVDAIHPTLGPVRLPGSPLKLSETPGRIDRPANPVGSSNHEIYGGLLGLSESELADLERQGII